VPLVPAYVILLSFLPLLLVVGAWARSVKRIERTRSLALGLQRHWTEQVLEQEAIIQKRVAEAEARVRAECAETIQAERAALSKEWVAARAIFEKGSNFLAPWTWTEVEVGESVKGSHQLVLMNLEQVKSLAKGWVKSGDVQIHFQAHFIYNNMLHGRAVLCGSFAFVAGDEASIDNWAVDAKAVVQTEYNREYYSGSGKPWTCRWRISSRQQSPSGRVPTSNKNGQP